MNIGYGFVKFFSKEYVEERKYFFWIKRVYHHEEPHKLEVWKVKENDETIYLVRCTNLLKDTFSGALTLNRSDFQQLVSELATYKIYDNELHNILSRLETSLI